MKTLNDWIGLIAAIVAICFSFIWLYVPEKKQAIQDWWYGMTLDCAQMHGELWNDQRCKTSDDCELAHKELIRAEKLEVLYARYCGSL